MTRNVKTTSSALARTEKPIADAMPIVATDGLENFVAGLGTDRDKRSYSAFAMPRVLTRFELENMFRGSWLAKRIVSAVPDDMTREWLDVQFDDDAEGENQFAFEQMLKKWKIKDKINDSLTWARLYGGCLIVIGTKDKDMTKPFDHTKVKKGDLRFLHVLDRWRVAPTGVICQDLDSPNFGMPDMYQVAESSLQIHHTRVLRFDGERLPYFLWRANAMWHDSSLQHVLDSLLNVDSISQSIATMFFEANVDVVTSEGLSEILALKDGEARLTKRFQLAGLMKSFNRMLLLDGKEKYEKKSNTFTNLDKIWQQFMIDVCGAADIPMTRLFGQSASGLQSTGDNDIRNYYDMVKAKQESDLRPNLEILFEILNRSETGSHPEDFQFTFNSLWQVSATESATIKKQEAETDQIYLDAGVLTEEQVARELKERGTYPNLTEDDIEDLAELNRPMDNEGNALGGVVPPAPAVPLMPGQETPPAAVTPPAKGKIPPVAGEVVQ